MKYPRVSYTDLDDLICKKSEEEVRSEAEGGEHSEEACAPTLSSVRRSPAQVARFVASLSCAAARYRPSVCVLLVRRTKYWATRAARIYKLKRPNPWRRFADTARSVVSANLLHGFDQFNLQNARTADLRGEWSGDEASTMHRPGVYASD